MNFMLRKLVVTVSLVTFSHVACAADITEVTSRSGIHAWLIEDHKLPMISMQFAFRGGVEQDPADQQGLAEMTMSLMTEGAGDSDARAFQKELADHSISMNFGASRDALEGGLKCLDEDQELAFKMLHEALVKPRFDQVAIARQRAQQDAAIRAQMGSPEWQGRYSLFQYLYGSHPYGYRHLGTERSLATIDRNDIRKFYARHIARDNLVIAAAGDITPTELKRVLDYVFRDLPGRAKLNTVKDIDIPSDKAVLLTTREGTQSSLLFAMPGPRRDDPDWYAAEVANYIVGGGGFSSRLMHKVRDEKGLTYGISTNLSEMEHGAIIVGQAATKNTDAGQAWNLIRTTMNDTLDDGATDIEVEQAKDYLVGSLPLALTSRDKIAGVLVELQLEHRSRDYLTHRIEFLRAVTREDVNRVLKKWFNPDKLTLSVVGKPEGLIPTQTKAMTRE